MLMKKIYILALLAAATATPSVAQRYILKGIEASDGMDRTEYAYDGEYRVTEIRRYDNSMPQNNHIIVVEYDEEGREVRNALYQDKNMVGSDNIEDYREAYYIEFYYGEDGRLSERINYNNLASGLNTPIWNMGGVMSYEYDSDGQVTWIKTYFDKEKTNLFQDVENIYENGHLMKSTTRTSDFQGGMDVSSVDEYTYTEDGSIQTKDLYRQNFTTGELEYTGAVIFSYDESGNLIGKETKGQGGSTTAKNTYDYPEEMVPASEVIFPYEIEETDYNELWSIFKNKPLSYDEYGFNEVTGGMSWMVTYSYLYDRLSVGVETPVADAKPEGVAIAAFSDGILVLDGVETGSLVRVFAADGVHVCDRTYTRGGVNLETLSPGVYYVSAGNGAVKVKL